MGGYQNSGPFLGTLNIRCRIIVGTQKRAIILTTTHMLQYIVLRLLKSNPELQAMTGSLDPADQLVVPKEHSVSKLPPTSENLSPVTLPPL